MSTVKSTLSWTRHVALDFWWYFWSFFPTLQKGHWILERRTSTFLPSRW